MEAKVQHFFCWHSIACRSLVVCMALPLIDFFIGSAARTNSPHLSLRRSVAGQEPVVGATSDQAKRRLCTLHMQREIQYPAETRRQTCHKGHEIMLTMHASAAFCASVTGNGIYTRFRYPLRMRTAHVSSQHRAATVATRCTCLEIGG